MIYFNFSHKEKKENPSSPRCALPKFNPSAADSFSYSLPRLLRLPLEQPNPCKKQEYCKRERKPGSPPDPRAALGHAEHTIHRASKTGASVVEAVIHVSSEGGGGSDFGGDGERDLFF